MFKINFEKYAHTNPDNTPVKVGYGEWVVDGNKEINCRPHPECQEKVVPLTPKKIMINNDKWNFTVTQGYTDENGIHRFELIRKGEIKEI